MAIGFEGQSLAKVGNSGNATGPHLHSLSAVAQTHRLRPHAYVYRATGCRSSHVESEQDQEGRIQVPANGAIMTFSGAGDFVLSSLRARSPTVRP